MGKTIQNSGNKYRLDCKIFDTKSIICNANEMEVTVSEQREILKIKCCLSLGSEYMCKNQCCFFCESREDKEGKVLCKGITNQNDDLATLMKILKTIRK